MSLRLINRFYGWCRNNRLTAALAMAVVLLLVAGTATTSFYAVKVYQLSRENDELRRKLNLPRLAEPILR